MNYSTVLFDFDYTLVDSSDGIVQSIYYSLNKKNMVFPSESEIRKTIGLTLEESFILLTGKKEKDFLEQLRQYFLESSKKIMISKVQVFEDTIFVLKWLKKNGMRVGVVSAKDHKTIEKIADQYGFLEYIDIIVGEDDVTQQKPESEQVVKAIDSLKVTRKSVLYVGDSLIDYQTACNAEVDFCAVTTGVTKADDFLEKNCVGIIPNLAQLIPLISEG